jgi:hypothetical protein
MAIFMFGIANAFADNIITFGKSTYSQVGDKIIFGSLGDEYAVSEFGNLGGNDFIPENAFKNLLGYEGYTEAYDYNPTYDGYYDSFYKNPLPVGKDLVAIGFSGLGANPREIQKAWVLRSEYERLNANEQANRMDSMDLTDIRIDTESKDRDNTLQNNLNIIDTNSKSRDTDLQNNINNETAGRENADKNLGKRITKETNQRKTADTKLDNKINKETSQRKTADIKLDNKIIKETTARKQADKQEKQERIIGDKKLHKEITTETKDRKSANKTLQKNINIETKERKTEDKLIRKDVKRVEKESKNRDNVLQDNINSEATTRGNADTQLQNNIDNETTGRKDADTKLDNRINDTNSRIDDVSNRVSKLEKTQFVVKTELKFVREKHLEVGVYGEYNVGRSVCSEVGLNIVIPIGESYLDRENKKINARLDRLEQKVGTSAVITRTVDNKGKLKSININQGQIMVNGEF